MMELKLHRWLNYMLFAADTLKRLHLPRDAERILFKTENTAK